MVRIAESFRGGADTGFTASFEPFPAYVPGYALSEPGQTLPKDSSLIDSERELRTDLAAKTPRLRR